MADLNSFKEKAGATANFIAERSKSFAKTTAWRAKLMTRIGKNKAEIASEKEAMKKTYLQLGKKYFELFGDAPDENLAELCDVLHASEKEISSRTAAIEELQETMKQGPVEEFEEEIVVSMDVDEEIEEETEKAETKAEEVVEEVKDVVEAVEEKAEETCECCVDAAEEAAEKVADAAEDVAEKAAEAVEAPAENE